MQVIRPSSSSSRVTPPEAPSIREEPKGGRLARVDEMIAKSREARRKRRAASIAADEKIREALLTRRRLLELLAQKRARERLQQQLQAVSLTAVSVQAHPIVQQQAAVQVEAVIAPLQAPAREEIVQLKVDTDKVVAEATSEQARADILLEETVKNESTPEIVIPVPPTRDEYVQLESESWLKRTSKTVLVGTGKLAANWYIGAAASTAAAALVGPTLAPVLAIALMVPATRISSSLIQTIFPTPTVTVEAPVQVGRDRTLPVTDQEASGITAQSRGITGFTWDSMKAVAASVSGMSAASAMSSLLFYGMLTDPYELARSATSLYINGMWGVPSFLVGRVMSLASSEWAWMRVVQMVSARVGWNTIGGRVGKAIHEYLSASERAQVPVLPERVREVAKQALGDERVESWVETTWAEMASGLARDYVDIAANRATLAIGRAGYDVMGQAASDIGKVYQNSTDGGISATFSAIANARDRAYEGFVSGMEATRSAYEGLKGAVQGGYSSVFGPVSDTLGAPETEIGPQITPEQQRDVARLLHREAVERAEQRREAREARQAEGVEQIKAAQVQEIKNALAQEQALEVQQRAVQQQITDIETQATIRGKEETTVQEEVLLDSLKIQRDELQRSIDTAKQLRETAFKIGGVGAQAFKGVTISAMAPQVLKMTGKLTGAAVDAINPFLDAKNIANIGGVVGAGVGAAATLEEGNVLKGTLAFAGEKQVLEAASSAAQAVGLETISAATATVANNVDWATSWYTGIRNTLRMTGNIMQGAADAYQVSGDTFSAQILGGMGSLINDYIIKYSIDLAQLKAQFLGIPEVDLGKVVTNFIISKYILRTSSSNARLAADALNSIFYGTSATPGEQNAVREKLEGWLINLFEGIDSLTQAPTQQ